MEAAQPWWRATRRSAEGDVVDADFGKLLPVSLLACVILAAPELEDDDLVFKTMLDDFSRDLGTGQGRNAGPDRIAVCAEQHVVEFDGSARITKKRWDSDRLARLGTELLAAGSYDRVAHDE